MATAIASAPLVSIETWFSAIASSACIGLTSLVPWLFNMTFFERYKSQKGLQTKNSRMDYLLSFSVGAILGDIFFHLIPESLESHLVELSVPIEIAQRKVGISMVAGIFMFIIVEMILEKWSNQENLAASIVTEVTDKCENRSPSSNIKSSDLRRTSDIEKDVTYENNNNSIIINNNSSTTDCLECFDHAKGQTTTTKTFSALQERISSDDQTIKQRKKNAQALEGTTCYAKGPAFLSETLSQKLNTSSLIVGHSIDPAGYLNLIANGIDNFTHGLAIGASFLVGQKVGFLTTFVIFIHEIPHEICDYAILVNSGFSRWDAVKAQSSVSLFGTMGTVTALYFKSIDTLNAKTNWILPFSAGGFLHIALVNLLPEILSRKTNFRDSIEQIGCVMLGIIFMGAVAFS